VSRNVPAQPGLLSPDESLPPVIPGGPAII
jgi:hypothetical protein